MDWHGNTALGRKIQTVGSCEWLCMFFIATIDDMRQSETHQNVANRAEDTMLRYNQNGKTYFLPYLDMHRLAVKKVDKFGQRLDGERRDAFRKLTDALFSVLDWRMFNAHVRNSLENENFKLSGGNIYMLNESINKVIRRIGQWVKRNNRFDGGKLTEFIRSIIKAARSICRTVDTAATCWAADCERTQINDG